MNFVKRILVVFACLSSLASVWANDLFVFKTVLDTSNLCFSSNPSICRLPQSSVFQPPSFPAQQVARLRIIKNTTSTDNNFYLDRPFIIIDGIHLSPDEPRTLSQFQKDVDEFGIIETLKALGYTPILAQFSQTVQTSLEKNSAFFSKILKALNSGKPYPFPNKKEDGIVVLGISQGGIIGRYGSYLYDKARGKDDAPIRLYASLDSPHQGAVMPRGLISTIDFWANVAGESSAEAYEDLIKGPGAQELLIYDTQSSSHDSSTASSRFLYGDYRKAAEYKGFPSVLLAQGQLKGKDPTHADTYYELDRQADKAGITMGRATSVIRYGNNNAEYSYNRKYRINDSDDDAKPNGETPFDFVQGSTYPFPLTMYNSLRDGFESAIPPGMKTSVMFFDISLNTRWNDDYIKQESSTFIPTVSAMDLKCNNDLAIRSSCAHTTSSKDVNFEAPGAKSTGNAVYAVDPTHPRFNEPISGRHIESPVKQNSIDQNVIAGMQTEIWRLLCELAKADYDSAKQSFRNPKLIGNFSPATSCMDQSKMPDIIKTSGHVQENRFAYARYDFNKTATESTPEVSFTLPAGWQKVGLFDNSSNVPAGSVFEIEIKVNKAKGNWMKAELLLYHNKNGGGQVQLNEQSVKLDGSLQTLRWQLPNNIELLKNYRWFRLILNSDGGDIIVSTPRIITNTLINESLPPAINSASIYPNNNYSIIPWSNDAQISIDSGSQKLLNLEFNGRYSGISINLGGSFSMEKYKELVVEFAPGSCQNTKIYFDSKSINKPNLVNNSLQNTFVSKKLPLSEIINTDATPKGSYSASRLALQTSGPNEKCVIKSILLQ